MTPTLPNAGSTDFQVDGFSYRTLVEQLPDALYILQNSCITFINGAGRSLLRAGPDQSLIGTPLSTILHPDYLMRSLRRVSVMHGTGKAAPVMEQKYLCLDGTVIDVEVRSVPAVYRGEPAIQVIARDITHRKIVDAAIRQDQEKLKQMAAEAMKAKEFLQVENRILEMMAGESNIHAVLQEVCAWVKRTVSEQPRVAVMLLENDGIKLRIGAAASLPAEAQQFICSMPIGPASGSCGTAMYLGQPVIVTDIATDPLWADYRCAALAHMLHACWAVPILSSSGIAIAGLALHYDNVHRPSADDINFVASVTHLIGAIIRKDLVERNFLESEDRYRSVVTSLTEGIVVQARNGVVVTGNPSAERILRVEPGALAGISRDNYCKRLIAADGTTIPRDQWPSRVVFRTGLPQLGLTVGLEMLDGAVVWLQQNILPIRRLGQTEFDTVLISFTDITEVKAAQQRLEFMATHDALTGLYNRAALTERLAHALPLAQRMSHQVAVLFLDLDRFKQVNDTIGHEAGDKILQLVSDRLRLCVRESDTLARLGGDEFVIMAEGFSDPAYLTTLCERVLQAMSEPFRIDEHEHYLGASIGIGLYPDDGNDWRTLLRCADSAMYYAKESGRNTYKFHTAQLNERTQRRYYLEKNLRHALGKKEFVLLYQPKINAQTGEIVGAEALVRWQSDTLGLVSPVEFISIAEETGLIVQLGEWVLEEACRQAAMWRKDNSPDLRIAVNLSARQFQDEALVENIKRILQKTNLPGEALELEITESLLMGEPERLMPVFDALIECGITFSLDDFGTGYSSLSYLQRFPISNIKIDRSFISGIPKNRDSVALTQAIMAMAQSLNMTVTAEGVEERAQESFLKQAACEEMQGYLFGKPVTASEFVQLLALCASRHAR